MRSEYIARVIVVDGEATHCAMVRHDFDGQELIYATYCLSKTGAWLFLKEAEKIPAECMFVPVVHKPTDK